MYKVLISDDDYNYIDSQLVYANIRGVDLVHFDNWSSAKQELENNWNNYKAIILDGKGKLTKDSKGEDVKHIILALNDLASLNVSKGYKPIVINTGFVDTKDVLVNQVYFEKGNEEEMFDHLLNKIKQTDEEQLKLKYADVFELYSKGYLKNDSIQHLLEVLYVSDSNLLNISYENFVTPIRKIIESLFLSLNDYGLLPNEFVENKIHLIPVLNFLGGNQSAISNYYKKEKRAQEFKLKLKKLFFPKDLIFELQQVLKATQEGSHLTGRSISKDKYKSMVFSLLNFLIFYKTFININPSKENNKSRYAYTLTKEDLVLHFDIIEGVLNIIDGRGVVKDVYNISKALVTENELEDYNEVRITCYSETRGVSTKYNVIELEKI
ncbi:MAG: hypothetical protein KAG14_02870 [Mycoplasmataceae bacterium]|nr:hypothetical protein [Mycoplasmataceae bacterium]